MYSRFAFVILKVAGLVRTANALSLLFSASSKDQVSDDIFDFQNTNNVASSAAIYTTELSVAGEKFTVQLDTGSSDLWLDTTGIDLSSFTDTGVKSSISYLDSTVAQGPVLIGNVTIGSFSASQALISAPGANATTYGDKGLLGVGPPLLSQINNDLTGTSFDGSPFLQNVFDDDPSLDEFITFALSRSESTGTTDGGIFTIGEIASNLTSVSSSPKLDVVLKSRWTVLMDGVIVNGKKISGNSAFLDLDVPSQQPSQTLANLDTGTGLALIPGVYADAIYGSIPGSSLDEVSGLYIVPCDAKVNVSFIFGGVEYPVHPIDTIQATLGTDGSIACFSGFLPTDVDPNESTEDFLLGDSFMRNVYAVFSFGSFISGTNPPTIQLLSTTDADKAYAEFDSLSAQRNQSLLGKVTNSGSSTSPTSPSSSRDSSATLLMPGTLYGWLSLATLALLSGLVIP
ncbi:hypothetical protein ACEPAF_963 [Sanghuangporus sanghuang]